ncbi:hypothetical protein LEMLEM_LOCUS14186 [Lemmus lemmus]
MERKMTLDVSQNPPCLAPQLGCCLGVPQPSQTALPLKDQVFQHMSLRGRHLTSKPQ